METATPLSFGSSAGGSLGRCTGIVSGAEDFYRDSLRLLVDAGFPFLIGGTYALNHYTGIVRPTKDLDLFLEPDQLTRALSLFSAHGFRTERTDDVWLAKVFRGECFIDLIFRSGNGIAEVDSMWFDFAEESQVFGVPVKLCPAEETIWSKAFTMERERYDGADIAHLILARGTEMDWARLIARFGAHWRVLFSYLVLFGYSYPDERGRVPRGVMRELGQRLQAENSLGVDDEGTRRCQGTLLSRTQYRVDVEAWGYRDIRGELTREHRNDK